MTTVCLTFDFDAVSIWVSTFKQTSATPVSRGEYGARVGLPRILELLAAKGVPASFYVPAHTAVSFPKSVHAIRAAGHEIGRGPRFLILGQPIDRLQRSGAVFRTLEEAARKWEAEVSR